MTEQTTEHTAEGFGFHTEPCDWSPDLRRVVGEQGGLGLVRRVGSKWESIGQQVWPPAAPSPLWSDEFYAMMMVVTGAKENGLVVDTI